MNIRLTDDQRALQELVAAAPHFLLKRAWVLEQQFGTSPAHASAIGSALGRECAA